MAIRKIPEPDLPESHVIHVPVHSSRNIRKLSNLQLLRRESRKVLAHFALGENTREVNFAKSRQGFFSLYLKKSEGKSLRYKSGITAAVKSQNLSP